MTIRPRRFAALSAPALAFVAFVAACQAPAGPSGSAAAGQAPATRPPATARPGAPVASEAPKAGAGQPSAAPTVSPVSLVAPTAGATRLAGRVVVDAAAMVAAGAGGVVTHGGAPLLLVAGARLVGQDGGSLVGNAGNTLVGNAGNTLVGNAGNTLVGNAGNTLVGNAGNTLVAGSDAAGNLVAAGAGNMVAAGAGNYRLAQVTAAPAPLAPGTALPAAGMLVSVVALADRRYLPLGEDGRGGKVYAVYTDAAGGFEVHVPAEARENVAVVASVPSGGDPRLAYNALQAPTAAAALDDVSAMAARYVRLAFAGRLAGILANPELAIAFTAAEDNFTPAAQARITAMIRLMAEAKAAAGRADETDERALADRAQRIVDATLARVELGAISASGEWATDWEGPAAPAMPTMREALLALQAGAAARLAADPRAFDQAFLANVINAPLATIPEPAPLTWDFRRPIATPRDVADFLLQDYFGVVRQGVAEPLRRMYRFLGGIDDPLACANVRGCPQERERVERASRLVRQLRAAAFSMNVALADTIVGDAEMRSRIEAILADP